MLEIIGQGSFQLLNSNQAEQDVEILYTEMPIIANRQEGSSLSNYLPICDFY